MRTDDDLRQAFAQLEPSTVDTAGRLGEVVAGGSRARRGRRRSAGLVLAAVAAMAAAAVPTVLSYHRSPAPAAPRPAAARPPAGHQPASHPTARAVAPGGAGLLRFPFTVDPVPGYPLYPMYLNTDYTAVKVGDGPDYKDRPLGSIVVFRKGRFDPTAVRRGTPVDINGKHGYIAPVPNIHTPTSGKVMGRPGLFWEYAPGAWAAVVGWWPVATAPTEEARLARAVHTDRSSTFTLPFRFGWLPAGQRFDSSEADVADAFGPPRAELHLYDGANSRLDVTVDLMDFDGVDNANTFVGGRPAVLSEGSLTVYYPSYMVSIQLWYPTRDTAAQLRRVAEHLIWAADVTDPRTWFDATTI